VPLLRQFHDGSAAVERTHHLIHFQILFPRLLAISFHRGASGRLGAIDLLLEMCFKRSSLSPKFLDGTNVVFFDPAVADVSGAKLVLFRFGCWCNASVEPKARVFPLVRMFPAQRDSVRLGILLAHHRQS
jgi:hypothetical protein